MVALLAEGVDRNIAPDGRKLKGEESPSSRRAWIEIDGHSRSVPGRRSPSSRRAWIEMESTAGSEGSYIVALLAEGVDRNVLKNGNIIKA